MDAKKDILWRAYLVYFGICLFGVCIIAQVINLQFIQGEHWRERAQQATTKLMNIDAVRGSIFAVDGSLLATSFPIYEIRVDMLAAGITADRFKDNVDTLSLALSNMFGDKSKNDFKKELTDARKNRDRYHLLKRVVTYQQLKELKKFPLFRLGKNDGGLIIIQKNQREKPFKLLASRTIGYEREDQKPVGIEGAYNNDLRGIKGMRLMQKISGGIWKPINSENEIEPQDGKDIITTIDINLQDVAENALLSQLIKQNAEHGCVILMEVETGEIRAIANLSRAEEGKYIEKYNYAVGESTEPGSTFKLMSIVALLEDGLAKITDSVDTEDGTTKYYDRTMKDSHKGGFGKISLQRTFEVSSNVGISKLIVKHYGKSPSKFIERLSAMNVGQPLGLEIPGEGIPRIKTTKDKDWYGTTLPWMSIGYETKLTPLQILTFYNAIANNGRMMKPLFVKEISKNGKTVEKREIHEINPRICSEETVRAARKILEGVVENGTAINLKQADYKIAGKTGTAQIANSKYGYKSEAKITYRASFVGYFPADKPKYSCIVVVNAPSNNVYYGNMVAGPIFREIADKVYYTRLDLHEELKKEQAVPSMGLPVVKAGSLQEIRTVTEKLNIPIKITDETAVWVTPVAQDKVIDVWERKDVENMVPNVVGMGLKDAVYKLESLGFVVKLSGYGEVIRQSQKPGTPIKTKSEIILELS